MKFWVSKICTAARGVASVSIGSAHGPEYVMYVHVYMAMNLRNYNEPGKNIRKLARGRMPS